MDSSMGRVNSTAPYGGKFNFPVQGEGKFGLGRCEEFAISNPTQRRTSGGSRFPKQLPKSKYELVCEVHNVTRVWWHIHCPGIPGYHPLKIASFSQSRLCGVKLSVP